MNKKESIFDQADRELPKAWYEVSYKKMAIATYASALALYYTNLEIFHIDSIPVHITSATLFIISVLADRQSTLTVLKANERSIKAGLGSQGKEIGIGRKHITNPDELVNSKRALALDSAPTLAATLIPPLGVGFTIGRALAVSNNLRIAKRINRTVEIANER